MKKTILFLVLLGLVAGGYAFDIHRFNNAITSFADQLQTGVPLEPLAVPDVGLLLLTVRESNSTSMASCLTYSEQNNHQARWWDVKGEETTIEPGTRKDLLKKLVAKLRALPNCDAVHFGFVYRGGIRTSVLLDLVVGAEGKVVKVNPPRFTD